MAPASGGVLRGDGGGGGVRRWRPAVDARALIIVSLSALLFITALLLVGCGGGDEGEEGGEVKQAPSRAAAVDVLEGLVSSLESSEWDAALAFLQVPEGTDEEKVKGRLDKLIDSGQISRDGVKVLSEKARFGKLGEVFPKLAGAMRDKYKLSEEGAWAFAHEPGIVLMQWTEEKGFQIVRLLDVGKLTP